MAALVWLVWFTGCASKRLKMLLSTRDEKLEKVQPSNDQVKGGVTGWISRSSKRLSSQGGDKYKSDDNFNHVGSGAGLQSFKVSDARNSTHAILEYTASGKLLQLDDAVKKSVSELLSLQMHNSPELPLTFDPKTIQGISIKLQTVEWDNDSHNYQPKFLSNFTWGDIKPNDPSASIEAKA